MSFQLHATIVVDSSLRVWCARVLPSRRSGQDSVFRNRKASGEVGDQLSACSDFGSGCSCACCGKCDVDLVPVDFWHTDFVSLSVEHNLHRLRSPPPTDLIN